MDLCIMPGNLSGTIAAIPSKSDAHRRLICAALACKPSAIEIGEGSRDIEATVCALNALGAQIKREKNGYSVIPLKQAEQPAGLRQVDCCESGSTLRFLLPVAAALGSQAVFVGQGRLPERPMRVLCELLRAHGAQADRDLLPISISGRLRGGSFELPGDISSQYISGLLFALPLLPQNSRIRLLSPLESAGYVEMTIRALKDYGIAVEQLQDGWRVPGGQHYCPPSASAVEGDWSNAAFWAVAGAFSPDSVTVTGLSPQSAQGDRLIRSLVRESGAREAMTGGALTVRRGEQHAEALTVDARNVPDLVPVLAVLGCGRPGETRITGCGRLRLKESDRIEAVCAMIRGLGGDAAAEGDNIVVRGQGWLRGGHVDSCNDHRIAMAAAVAAGLCREPVRLTGAQAVEKSYPGFWRDFKALGGKADVL